VNFSISCIHWCFNEVGDTTSTRSTPATLGGLRRRRWPGSSCPSPCRRDQRAARLRREQRPFTLIGIERHLQQFRKLLRADSAWKTPPRPARPGGLVSHPGRHTPVHRCSSGTRAHSTWLSCRSLEIGRTPRASGSLGRRRIGARRLEAARDIPCPAETRLPAARHIADKLRRTAADDPTPRRPSLPGVGPAWPTRTRYVCTFPSVLTAKSGHEQKFSPSACPRIATRYVRRPLGMVTSNSEKIVVGEVLDAKLCSWANSRRSPIANPPATYLPASAAGKALDALLLARPLGLRFAAHYIPPNTPVGHNRVNLALVLVLCQASKHGLIGFVVTALGGKRPAKAGTTKRRRIQQSMTDRARNRQVYRLSNHQQIHLFQS